MNMTIPGHEQQGVMETFWVMLRECETKADNDDDALLKRWVEQWYRQWNRLTGKDQKPRWLTHPIGE